MVNMKIHILVFQLMTGLSFQSQLDTCNNKGKTIRIDPDVCLHVFCDKTGHIRDDFPLGRDARKCCECSGKLYGENSGTCKFYRMNNNKCPATCQWPGNPDPTAQGDIGKYLPADCARERCLNGKFVKETPFGDGMKGCCLDNDDKKNPLKIKGGKIDDGGCLSKTCQDGIWIPAPKPIMPRCKKCNAHNDPHFNDFSGVYFDWHDGCNYALVQEGISMQPNFGVFMDFNRVGTIGYIGGPTTYQEDETTKVLLNPLKLSMVTVNGQDQHISLTPTLLLGLAATETSVYAWKISSCVRLYGKPKILVELCEASITIWAPPKGLSYPVTLGGLCGSTDKNALKAKKLVARDGIDSALSVFAKSWKAEEQTKDNCKPVGKRKRSLRKLRSVEFEEIEAEKIRTACTNVVNSLQSVNEKCLKAVNSTGLTAGNHHLDACKFDLCIAFKDPAQKIAGYTEEKMLEQHNEIAIQSKSHIESTIEFVPDENKCPTGWSPIGGQCFQAHKFDDGLSISDVVHRCISDKATLAQPTDVTAFNNYIKEAFPEFVAHPTDITSTPKDPNRPNGCLILLADLECITPKVYICEREPLACVDDNPDCAWLAADGECEGNRAYMFNQCKESCKVPCECDQPRTCTDVGGICQPSGTMCDVKADSKLCSGDTCTCCYVPDLCQDSGDRECKKFLKQGLCDSTDVDILDELNEHCSRSCDLCAVCPPGYTGNKCDTPICLGGCGTGKCTSPNSCTCSDGYTGDTCDTQFVPVEIPVKPTVTRKPTTMKPTTITQITTLAPPTTTAPKKTPTTTPKPITEFVPVEIPVKPTVTRKPTTMKPTTITQITTLAPPTTTAPKKTPTTTPKPITVCGIRHLDGYRATSTGTNHESHYGEFPWMVAVLTQYNNEYVAGGSLVHPRVVLTAAHKVKGESGFVASIGDWHLSERSKEKFITALRGEIIATQTINVMNVVFHPGFNRNTLEHDIALLILESDAVLGNTVMPICLPEPDQVFDGANCTLTGWGRNEGATGDSQKVLKKVNVPAVNHNVCQRMLRKTRLGRHFNLHNSFNCAGGEGEDTCDGDGGSPLICPNPNKPTEYVQMGVAAWVIGCSTKGNPGVYGSVPKNVNWINQNIIEVDGIEKK